MAPHGQETPLARALDLQLSMQRRRLQLESWETEYGILTPHIVKAAFCRHSASSRGGTLAAVFCGCCFPAKFLSIPDPQVHQARWWCQHSILSACCQPLPQDLIATLVGGPHLGLSSRYQKLDLPASTAAEPLQFTRSANTPACRSHEQPSS